MVLSSTEETHILQKIRQKKDAINYVSVLLVNDPIEVFQNIVNVRINFQPERERLSRIIESKKSFITYQFPKIYLDGL